MIEGYRRSCGMDIHKDTVVVCVLPAMGTDGEKSRKTFGTFRNDLIRMRVWLKQLKVSEVAMEIHRRLLATRLERSRRARVSVVAGESRSGQGSGRSQERWP